MIRAMTRLGHKYQAEAIVKKGVRLPSAHLPSSIDKWDQVKVAANVIALANVARLLKDYPLHSRALYRCTQLSPEVLLNGCIGADGIAERLCREDLLECINNRGYLQSLHVKIMSTEIFEETLTGRLCTKCDLSLFRCTLLSQAELWNHDFLGDPHWPATLSRTMSCVLTVYSYSPSDISSSVDTSSKTSATT